MTMAVSLSGTFLKFSAGLLLKKKSCLCMRHVRHRMKWRPSGKALDLTKTLEEKLNDMQTADPELDKEINIGFPLQQDSVSERMRQRAWQTTRGSKEVEARERRLKVVLDDVKEAWLHEYGPRHIRSIVGHYGIYRDLFEGAYFYPTVHLNISYDYDDEFMTPVYTGNKIPPAETGLAPNVQYESDPETLWTLVMSSPDGHLADSQSECLHWMVGNIPGSSVDKGETICDYIQPFPPRGVGFMRYVFILYKQDKKIDFSKEKRPQKCLSLKDRKFKTFDFYSDRQDVLTPASLAFFQSEWDMSVQQLFRHVLDMPEPVFEFIYPPPYHPVQKRYPIRQPFNLYLDRYKDVKEIQEEVLKEKLKRISPFAPHPPSPKYPGLKPLPLNMPSWLKTKVRNMRFRRHQWKDLPGERQ
ncbi:39S ribosomal protein L38, mitochondrial-like [Gigantopelta aegis]|uniref:39S ribosomal protein L38, mitochondrial-like n=1 Tax=Gigantopelta aegis TaxID=1735272 RepID=UPI001B88A0EF|nr:39S ribosomal protein L38, mitochondrial-like [Gigantopelta aegis]